MTKLTRLFSHSSGNTGLNSCTKPSSDIWSLNPVPEPEIIAGSNSGSTTVSPDAPESNSSGKTSSLSGNSASRFISRSLSRKSNRAVLRDGNTANDSTTGSRSLASPPNKSSNTSPANSSASSVVSLVTSTASDDPDSASRMLAPQNLHKIPHSPQLPQSQQVSSVQLQQSQTPTPQAPTQPLLESHPPQKSTLLRAQKSSNSASDQPQNSPIRSRSPPFNLLNAHGSSLKSPALPDLPQSVYSNESESGSQASMPTSNDSNQSHSNRTRSSSLKSIFNHATHPTHKPKSNLSNGPITTSTSYLPSKNSTTSLISENSTTTTNNTNSITTAPSTSLSCVTQRFVMYKDGTHAHLLRSAKRQEKIGNMLKDLLGGKKLRNEAVSAIPSILMLNSDGKDGKKKNQPQTLISGLVNSIQHGNQDGIPSSVISSGVPDTELYNASFLEKYGSCQEVVGKGAFGVVRISHKIEKDRTEKFYAVKEFKRKPTESEEHYSKRLTSEFCISSSLRHPNIVITLDLLKDAKGDFCEVMEYCSGGDLYTLILYSGRLETAEADCFFKQLIRGMDYMHDMGVAHRDLKPENLLLTQNGNLKITDFGNGECFRMAWERNIRFSNGLCGSGPYIAPEEYLSREFDPRAVDVWACGIIYMAMRTGRYVWNVANAAEDEFYERYLLGRRDEKGYEPIEALKRDKCKNVIYSILDPVPGRRITCKQILNSEWGREIVVCPSGEEGV